MTKQINAKPFLKWAGGKQKVLSQLERLLPQELKQGNCKTYMEPFVGAGTMLFHVLQHYQVKRAIISDTNKDLINTYLTVQQNVEELIERLQMVQSHYHPLTDEDRSIYYYRIREEFNHHTIDSVERAAQFIFLNKTCFNGLYRVNKKGEFNVPTGRYVKPVICDEENLRKCATVLKDVEIYNQSYEESREMFSDETFCYMDPPYRPLDAASFTKYSEYGFSEEDQVKLAEFYSEMDKKGAKLMISNSDPTSLFPGDTFFDENYGTYTIHKIKAGRSINSNPLKRGKVSELLIINY